MKLVLFGVPVKQLTDRKHGESSYVSHTLPTDLVFVCYPCFYCFLWCLQLKLHGGGTAHICVRNAWHSEGS